MRHTMWRLVRSVVKSHQHSQLRFASTYLQKQRLRDAAASIILNDPVPSTEYSQDLQQDLEEFNSLFPEIERDLSETTSRYADAEMANKWFQKVLQYNMTGGSKSRGLAVVQSYRILAAPEDVIPENVRLAQIMGWCLELLHTSLVLTQDLIDQARERRGKPCWYLQNPRQAPDGAARLIESAVYKLLKKYFRKKEYYVDALELFHTVGEKAMLGKVLDMETRGDPTLSQFDMTTYNTISKYRNAYHSFKLPVSLALYMAGIRISELHRQARTIQLEMGNFYQAQCDFFNCYGGGRWHHKRPGHDIEDGRCTWLIVVALQRATPTQKKALIENYGKRDEEKVNRVKELYGEIGIPQTYKLYEEHSYELLCNQIQQTSSKLPHHLFFRYLKTMTGR
ncbi:farnesyl pyrophosphate synthase-like [Homalodisca vitripennis]|uniref:Farnesyl pyrophosphate synthase n=1 Tax=Homalodisca liturata TaxID=320908 RepID=A0A1B6IL30_9HEMI|nr:farnesyl pyrophosphate synthase-like [Homalodisca vitripennis]